MSTVARAVRSGRLNPEGAVPVLGLALAALIVLVGQAIKATGGRLGVFFPPFYIQWHPHVGPLAAVSLAAALGAAALTPQWIQRVRRPPVVAAGLFALALALGVSLNVARGGIHELWAIFQIGPQGSPEAGNEYLAGPPALSHGIAYYVAHFPSLFPSLPQKVTGNPPGPLVALHLLGISTPGALAAFCIGTGALTAPLAYDLGRTLGGEQRGRVAGVLSAFAPSLLLWGVTSVDYAFATLGLAAACLLVRDRVEARIAGALLAAVGSFFSWLLFAIPAWAVLLVVRRAGTRRGVALGLICALATAAVYLTLALVWGYDPFAALKATDGVYRQGIAHMRPYAYWVFGSPVAWGLALGLPTAWALLRAAGAGDEAALALLAVVFFGAALGYTKAETERIWLPFVPLACVAAARVLPLRSLRPTLWLLVSQALVTELLFNTIW